MPHQKDGKWIYDSSITLVDRDRHIRRAVVPQKRGGQSYVAAFDFDQAAEWDAKGVKTGIDKTNTEQLEFLLNQTIEELLAQPATPWAESDRVVASAKVAACQSLAKRGNPSVVP